MLLLSDTRWSEISHAYGFAIDTPDLIRALTSYPESAGFDDEPWYSLWSSLCHQGDIYEASLAALPHIVNILELNPQKAGFDFIALPTSIEISRLKSGLVVPEYLRGAYFDAIQKLASLVPVFLVSNHDYNSVQAATAAIAVSAGKFELAELLLEIEEDIIPEALEWYSSR